MTKQINGKEAETALLNFIAEQTVDLQDVLLVCTSLGKMLQGIPANHRKLAISRIRNKRNELAKECDSLGALMLGVVAESWDDFS